MTCHKCHIFNYLTHFSKFLVNSFSFKMQYYIDGNSMEGLLNSIQTKEEMQSIFFLSLCCLGAWVILSWTVQVFKQFSLLQIF